MKIIIPNNFSLLYLTRLIMVVTGLSLTTEAVGASKLTTPKVDWIAIGIPDPIHHDWRAVTLERKCQRFQQNLLDPPSLEIAQLVEDAIVHFLSSPQRRRSHPSFTDYFTALSLPLARRPIVSERLLQVWRELVQDGSTAIQKSACFALADAQDMDSISRIQRLLKASNPVVREFAAQSLTQLGAIVPSRESIIGPAPQALPLRQTNSGQWLLSRSGTLAIRNTIALVQRDAWVEIITTEATPINSPSATPKYHTFGAQLIFLHPQSNLRKVGLLEEDIIVKVNHIHIVNYTKIPKVIKSLKPGQTLDIHFYRPGTGMLKKEILVEK